MDVDPITLEVVRNALVGIAEEAGAALRRTAWSPNIKERADCSTAVFGPDARMVAQAEHIPVHLGAMPASVRAALEVHGELDPGDQVLVSDPYSGGTHLPDWTLVAPVHHEGRLLGHAATRAHQSDVGGAAPGSMPAGATDVLQEGLRIPPVRLVRGGVVEPDLLRMLLANTRTPEERQGDLRAQVGANELIGRRLVELAERQGRDLLVAAMTATMEHARAVFVAAVRRLPEGTATFRDVMDDDGVGDQPVTIAVEATVRDGRVRLDFSASDDQVPGSINAPLAVTQSAALYAVRSAAAPHVPANDGMMEAIEVVAREGSVVHPRSPASVAAGNVETSQRIVDVVFGALAQLWPDRVPAASQGTMNNTLVGGIDPRTGEPFSYYETIAGGQGGHPECAGMSGVHTHMTNTKNTPVEAFEVAYPMRVVEYRLRSGSGGAGQHPGGEGVRRVLEVLADRATVSVLGERRRRGPWGLAGGQDGAPGRNALVRDGEERDLEPKVTLQAVRGDLVVVETPGGGGWGSPTT